MIFNFPGCLVVGIEFLGSPFQPICQFVAVGEDTTAATAWQAVHGKFALRFPAPDSPHVPSEESGDLFPGIQATLGVTW
jgi:hypothetical protein